MPYDPDKRWEIHADWVALLRDYNGTQNALQDLVKERKELGNDKNWNRADFKKNRYHFKLRQKYKTLLEVAEQLPGMEQSVKQRLREEEKNEANLDRGKAIKEVDDMIARLVAERKAQAELMDATIKENLTARLNHIKKQWLDNPPNGYKDVRDSWIEYITTATEQLKEKNLADIDDGSLEFPNGESPAKVLFEDANKWWNMANNIEDSYKDFVRFGEGKEVNADGDFVDLTDAKLEEEFTKLQGQIARDMNDAEIDKFKAIVGQVKTEAASLKTEIERKIKSTKDQERKWWEDQLKTVEEQIGELEKHEDIKAAIRDAFFSEEGIETDKPDSIGGVVTFGPKGGEMVVPRGLKGQLEFLKKAPMSTAERRAVARTLLEGMKGVGEKIMSYKDFGEVQLTETLENMRLFRTSLNEGTGRPTRDVVMINPFETLGHFWHSVTETVKGNVETEAKRGAGYWQRDATKILTHIPNPTNNQMIKSLTELHPNGAQEAEHAEHGRVGDIEKGYDSFNTEHLMHLAAETIDRFEFKACLNILAKRGRVDFYAPWLFKQLNRWQKTVKISEDRYWHQKNLTSSEEKMRQAYIYIYRDSEAFKSLKNTNASSYESKMKEYEKNWGGIAAEPGALVNEAQRILDQYEADHHAGKHFSTADPIKFESIIRYAVAQGKMKGEARMRFLVLGISSGLLPFDRGVNTTDTNNTYPPFDWFDSGVGRGDRPTIDDIKEAAAYAKNETTWDYYMHKSVMYNTTVQERFEKTLSQGSHRVDHDDAPMLAGYLGIERVKDMLTQKTQGGYGMPKTGLMSLATGNEFWLDMYGELYAGREPKQNKLEMVRFASQFLTYEGVLNRRAYKGAEMFRLEPSDAAKPPRTSGIYSKVFAREEKGTGAIVKGVADYLTMLDFDSSYPLIKKMVNDEIRTDDDAKAIINALESQYGIWNGDPPKGIDDLYKRIAPYLEYAVNQTKEDNLGAMVAKLQQDHRENIAKAQAKAKAKGAVFADYTKALHDAEHEADHVRASALERAQGVDVDNRPHKKPAEGGGGGESGGGHH